MPNHLIRRLAFLGAISIIGIVLIQAFTLTRSYSIQDEAFDQTVRVSLYQVAESLSRLNNSLLPKKDLVQRKSANYYAVNINDVIDANILEDYLIREFESRGVNTDFEYAVYDCQSQEMVYGNYCKLNELEDANHKKDVLPKFDNLIYYFVVGFPSRKSYLIGSIWQQLVYSLITLLALVFFIYSMWVILQQKKLSELQKDFINNMTHEFKTPITSIKIAADVIKNDPLLKNNDRLLKYSSIIKEQNDRLNEQVEKVLNLARLEEDSFKLKLQQFNAIDTLRNIISSENFKLQQNNNGNIVLKTESKEHLIKADKLHFSNVIYNILDNAIKYSSKNPKIVVETFLKGKELIISISDNGIGIKKEHLENLFKKFYRIPTGNIHNVKGFGLGLYYVHNICKTHGWEINVDSRPGQGSNFIISIPNNV